MDHLSLSDNSWDNDREEPLDTYLRFGSNEKSVSFILAVAFYIKEFLKKIYFVIQLKLFLLNNLFKTLNYFLNKYSFDKIEIGKLKKACLFVIKYGFTFEIICEYNIMFKSFQDIFVKENNHCITQVLLMTYI